MIINTRAVKDLARSLDPKKRKLVIKEFLEHIDAMTRTAIADRLKHHDNATGARKKIV